MRELPLNGPELLVTFGCLVGIGIAVLTLEPAQSSSSQAVNTDLGLQGETAETWFHRSKPPQKDVR